MTRQLGARGLVRVDGIYRSWTDFYFSAATRPPAPSRSHRHRARSDRHRQQHGAERQYAAMNVQGAYRLGHAAEPARGLHVLAHLGQLRRRDDQQRPDHRGHVSAGSATTGRTGWGVYPEYHQAAWNQPVGDLANDQRHRARFWTVWRLPLSEQYGNLSVSAVEQINTGSPYFAAGPVNPNTFVTNTFGYQSRRPRPPTSSPTATVPHRHGLPHRLGGELRLPAGGLATCELFFQSRSGTSSTRRRSPT